MTKYTNPVRNFCKQKLRPLPTCILRGRYIYGGKPETFLNKINPEHPEHDEQEFEITFKGPPLEGPKYRWTDNCLCYTCFKKESSNTKTCKHTLPHVSLSIMNGPQRTACLAKEYISGKHTVRELRHSVL